MPAPGQTPRLVRGEDGSHGYAGLIRCGSVWTCPVCRFHVARERGAEIEEALRFAHEHGLHVTFVTLTARHAAGDALDPLWKAVRTSATAMFQGRRGKAWRESVGYTGRITAHELTVGVTGWHPHVHLLLVSTQPVEADQTNELLGLWEAATCRHGLTVSRSAQDVQRVKSGDAALVSKYVSKMSTASWTLTAELTDVGGVKEAQAERFTPFQLLDVVEATGDADAADAFREYAFASRGVSSLRWSPGLRDALGVRRPELTDEEAANKAENEVQDVYFFSPSEWSAVFLTGLRVELLEAADRDGMRGVQRVVAQACSLAYGRGRSPPSGRMLA